MRRGGGKVIRAASREPDSKAGAANVKRAGQEGVWTGGSGPCTDAGGGRGDSSDGGLAEKRRADLHRTSRQNLCTRSLGFIGSEQRERRRGPGRARRKCGLRGACEDEDVRQTCTSAA